LGPPREVRRNIQKNQKGVVTAAEMLALAGFMEGHKAQAFPSFGSERTGAPGVAFARLSSVEIRLREPGAA